MALNLKNADVERLVNSVVVITGESKTQAIRVALSERLERLAMEAGIQDRSARFLDFLESEVWPLVPAEERGRRMTRAEEEDILGFGGSET